MWEKLGDSPSGEPSRRLDRIPEDVIDEIRDRADIVEIISRVVDLKRAGSTWKGLCPFHEEKTPSFVVTPARGTYKCFGCGEGGNVIRFMMERMGYSFLDALAELSKETGVPLPRRERTPQQQEQDRMRNAVREALDFAASYFRHLLLKVPDAEAARRYLADRGFTAQTLQEYGVGWARDEFDGPRSLLGYATGKGIAVEVLEAAGLVRTNQHGKRYDFFRGRVMFPIRDPRGRVIAFGGRVLDSSEPKYVNSPDTPVFHKSRELYGQDLARSESHAAGRLLVVEGYTDVMHCRQGGFKASVAGLGTALTPENARNLRRFGVPVVLLYDGDAAGLKAAERGADALMAEEVDGSVAILPAGQDPADLLTREGPAALDDVLDGAQPLIDYRVARLAARYDLSTIDGGARAAKEMLAVIARMKDPVRRDLALRMLSERLGVSESSLRSAMPHAPASPPKRPAPAVAAAPIDDEPPFFEPPPDAGAWDQTGGLEEPGPPLWRSPFAPRNVDFWRRRSWSPIRGTG